MLLIFRPILFAALCLGGFLNAGFIGFESASAADPRTLAFGFGIKSCKARGGDRAKKLFQFLNIIGAQALGRHLGRALEMAESSADKYEYETKIAKRFGFEQQLELPISMPASGMNEAAN